MTPPDTGRPDDAPSEVAPSETLLVTPFGEVELHRHPEWSQRGRRAWDAADELVLMHLAENALVGPAGLVWLIDFSETREGHVLYDFARLGAELIGHVLAPRAGDPAQFLEAWRRDQQDPATLAGTVFALPRRLRADAQSAAEFELCLTVACLGALKHDNLDSLARACLYLAAADLAARRP